MYPTKIATTTVHAVPVSLLNPLGVEVDTNSDLQTMYLEYPWGDLWADADILAALKYVRGSKRLRMPESWRAIFPSTLPPVDECWSD